MNILNKSLSELQKALSTDFSKGLSAKGVRDNTDAFGLNTPFDENESILAAFLKSLLSDVMPWLFLAICVLSFIFEKSASLVISVVLFFVYIALRFCVFGYIKFTDRKINSYRTIFSTVIRGGKHKRISARHLVPGDILLLKSGELVPCDCIIIESEGLSVYESFITAECRRVLKKPQNSLGEGEAYHDCLLFTGSVVADGNAKVLVCHTGDNIFNVKNGPLKKLFVNEMPKIYKNNLFVGKQLYLLWILMCFVVFAIGVLLKYDVFNMFFISVTLSLAALGDCIPLFSEAAMLSNVAKLYKKHGCILKNYKAIDTFNSTDTVFIENFNYFLNAMPEIKSFYINNSLYSPSSVPSESRKELLKYAVASMMAQPKSRRYTDISLAKYAASQGITLKNIENDFLYISKYTAEIEAVLTFRGGEYAVISRGFAADMLSRCTTIQVNGNVREIGRNERFALQNHIHNMELDSQTVIAVVKKAVTFSSETQNYFIDLDKMTLIGFIGFYNPISTEAVKALSLCKKNNINVVLMENSPMGAYLDMAKSTSLFEDDDLCVDSENLARTDEGLFRAELKRYKIFSRLSHEQQLYIANLYKENGSIITCIPNSIDDIPLQAASDASVAAHDEKLSPSSYFADAVFLKKNFSVFTAIIRHSRAVYHNANRMLLYILTNQFYICTLILIGMIFEKTLIFQPSVLLLYGIFSVFPSALAISCDTPQHDKQLSEPSHNRYIFQLLSLLPPPFIVGLSGGIITALVHRIYASTPQTAAAASLVTLFAGTFLVAISMRDDELFIRRKLSAGFRLSLFCSVVVLTIVFAIKPLSSIMELNLPNIEVAFVSVIFAFIPFAISEIIKKAKNLTK